ncbi:MAG: STAS domain-containing protein [Verrucomicrobia bacterium]|nr:STAS domain-containing protein [Verrucomicrobiota bacterium]
MHAVKKTDNVAVVTVDPALSVGDKEQIESLKQLCADLQADGYTRLVLDMSEVGHAPSLVLGNIIVLHKRIKMREGEVVILNPSPVLKRILSVTKMDQILRIYEDEAQAIRALAGST